LPVGDSLNELILYSVPQGGPPSSAYEKEEGEGMKNGWRSEKEEQENNNNTEKNKNNGRALSPGLETLQQTLYNHGKHEKICTQRNCANTKIFAQPIFFHFLLDCSNFWGKELFVTNPKVGGWENVIWSIFLIQFLS
jgi:hypothetical protein